MYICIVIIIIVTANLKNCWKNIITHNFIPFFKVF